MFEVRDELSGIAPEEARLVRELGARLRRCSGEIQNAAASRVRDALSAVVARRLAERHTRALLEPLLDAARDTATNASTPPPPRAIELLTSAWAGSGDDAVRRFTMELRDEALRGVSSVALASEIEHLVTPDERNYLRAEVAMVRDFLDASARREVEAFAASHEDVLRPTAIAAEHMDEAARAGYRSSISTNAEALRPLLFPRVERCLDEVNAVLRLDPFAVADVEAQYTVSRDGDHYGMHTDNERAARAGALRSRLLTFVYYFHVEPKAFSGGELRVHDTVYVRERPMPGGQHVDVVPEPNAIVFFDAALLHEVLTVYPVSDALTTRTGRRTLNGWLHGVRNT